MAGYERKTLALKFEDPELEGLVVRMKRLPIGDLFGVQALAEVGRESSQQAQREALESLVGMVHGSLLSWNLQENGVDVPTTLGKPAHTASPGCCELAAGVVTETDEVTKAVVGKVVPNDTDGARHPSTGLYSVDTELIMAIVEAWMSAAAGVSRPLPKTSNSGRLSPEEFEAMAAKSESLSSSSTPEPSSASLNALAATP